MQSRRWCACAFAVLVLAPLGSARAAYIVGVTATTTMGTGFGTNLVNTVNGVGLSSISLTATHAGTIPTNSWVSNGPLTGSITFTFTAPTWVNSFSFWNQNGGGPGLTGSTGIQNVTVQYSPDGITFVALPGGPTVFARMTAGNLPTDALAPEIFNFAPLQALAFRFVVASNYGDAAQTGFAEVAFNDTPAPPMPPTPTGGEGSFSRSVPSGGEGRFRLTTGPISTAPAPAPSNGPSLLGPVLEPPGQKRALVTPRPEDRPAVDLLVFNVAHLGAWSKNGPLSVARAVEEASDSALALVSCIVLALLALAARIKASF